MVGGLVGVAVDHVGGTCLAQPGECRVVVHVGIRLGRLLFGLASQAKIAGNGPAFSQRLGQKIPLPWRTAH